MRNARKYRILSFMAVLLSILLLGNCIREPFRMAAAEEQQHDEYVLKGAKTYAQNCVQCHGPRGEGVVGLPLNRKDYQLDPNTPAGKDVYNMLVRTLKQGRPGADTPTWKRVDTVGSIVADNVRGTQSPWTGEKISYSTMPAWGRDYGGAFDDDYIKALALFIMNNKPLITHDPATGEQLTFDSQWGGDFLGKGDPDRPWEDPLSTPWQKTDTTPDPKTGVLKVKNDEDPANAPAVTLLRDVTKSQCLACHTIGSKGGKIGPDLSFVGNWGVDEAFLTKWITDPRSLKQEERMPVYWSASRANKGPFIDTSLKKVVSEVPVFMPSFGPKVEGHSGSMTEQDIATIARYLTTLK